MRLNRKVFSWTLYDWANSAFTLVVVTGFFPIFFRQYWAAEESSSAVTFYLGMVNAAASLVIALLAPFLGTVADLGGLKKRFLGLFAFLGILMTLSLYWVGAGQWQIALLLYLFGSFGFMGANVFYDAMLVDVSSKKDFDQVSAWGYAMGYIGSALLFTLCVWMTLSPQTFGLNNSSEAVRLSFLLVAIWWLLFSLPLFFFVREKEAVEERRGLFAKSWRQLLDTLKHLREYKPVVIFLLAYWLYIDGVGSIVRMAVDYGQALGFASNSLIKALLMTQFVAFPAAVMFGYLGAAIGTRRALLLGLGVYILVTIWAATINQTWEFYVLAFAIGMVQGGVQALSRSLYAQLIPRDQAAEFFGFYNLLGKSAAVLGPMMIGGVAILTGSHRLAMLILLVLFIAGAVLLMKVPLSKRTD